MSKKDIIIFSVLICLAGTTVYFIFARKEVPDVKPMSEQLAAVPQEWRDAYGDSQESQITYNLAILRHNQLMIARMMNKMHPNDPNDPNNLKLRIEKIETAISDPNNGVIIKE